jgi:hypothetical protein
VQECLHRSRAAAKGTVQKQAIVQKAFDQKRGQTIGQKTVQGKQQQQSKHAKVRIQIPFGTGLIDPHLRPPLLFHYFIYCNTVSYFFQQKDCILSKNVLK